VEVVAIEGEGEEEEDEEGEEDEDEEGEEDMQIEIEMQDEEWAEDGVAQGVVGVEGGGADAAPAEDDDDDIWEPAVAAGEAVAAPAAAAEGCSSPTRGRRPSTCDRADGSCGAGADAGGCCKARLPVAAALPVCAEQRAASVFDRSVRMFRSAAVLSSGATPSSAQDGSPVEPEPGSFAALARSYNQLSAERLQS